MYNDLEKELVMKDLSELVVTLKQRQKEHRLLDELLLGGKNNRDRGS